MLPESKGQLNSWRLSTAKIVKDQLYTSHVVPMRAGGIWQIHSSLSPAGCPFRQCACRNP